MPLCTLCDRVFYSDSALHAHCRDRTDHAYCVSCERLFVSFQALNQHLDKSSVHNDYASDSDDYYNYNTSEEEDDDDDAHCASCNRNFVNRASLFQHLASSQKHNWCFICSRDFATASALDKHENSQVHRSRDLSCPLCSRKFKVPSAIALHIEAGTCHNFSRHEVTKAVQSLKIAAPVSITRRIGPASSSSTTTPVITYLASERAFNGYAYECYICHRTFKTLTSLNAHLGSPVHDADEFKCSKCQKKYKLISGLIQHIESESCGVAKFKEVVEFANDLSAQFSRLLKF